MNRDAIDTIERRAVAQHGVFSSCQAAEVGVDADMLEWHSRRGGRWRRCAPRVYELSGLPGDWRRPLMAASLSLGPTGVVSHASAARLLGLDGVSHRQARPEVTVTDGAVGWGWRMHRRYQLPVRTMVTDGIMHTDPLWTMRDVCSVLDDDYVEMALESALRLGYMSVAQFETLAAIRGWKGVRRLRAVLERRPAGAAPTGSELETRYVQLVRVLGLPEPQRQYAVVFHGEVIAYLDLAWPEVGLFVELDGGTHEELAALRRDRQRQNDIVRILGWRPLRFTWSDVVGRAATTGRVTRAAYAFSNKIAV